MACFFYIYIMVEGFVYICLDLLCLFFVAFLCSCILHFQFCDNFFLTSHCYFINVRGNCACQDFSNTAQSQINCFFFLFVVYLLFVYECVCL